MIILALGVVSVSLIWWFFVRREQPVSPVVRWVGGATGIVVLGLFATLRAGPFVGLLVVAAGSFLLWVSMGGRGGDDPGDDGPDPPPDPEPDPGTGKLVQPQPERLDGSAFDRARAEWERELPKRS
jgi:hypothetical protein